MQRLEIELDMAPGPIRGVIRSDGGPARAFSGWTELGTTIEQLRSQGDEDAAGAPRRPEPGPCPTAAPGG